MAAKAWWWGGLPRCTIEYSSANLIYLKHNKYTFALSKALLAIREDLLFLFVEDSVDNSHGNLNKTVSNYSLASDKTHSCETCTHNYYGVWSTTTSSEHPRLDFIGLRILESWTHRQKKSSTHFHTLRNAFKNDGLFDGQCCRMCDYIYPWTCEKTGETSSRVFCSAIPFRTKFQLIFSSTKRRYLQEQVLECEMRLGAYRMDHQLNQMRAEMRTARQ